MARPAPKSRLWKFKLTHYRAFNEASKAMDADWNAAREALFAHIATHSKAG